MWYDVNGNGIMDAGEPGLAGAIMRLYDGDDPAQPLIRLPFVTEDDGLFHFDDLMVGRYVLVEENPPGYVSTTGDMMYVWIYSGVTTPVNFGDWIPSTATPTATIEQPFKMYLPDIRKGGCKAGGCH